MLRRAISIALVPSIDHSMMDGTDGVLLSGSLRCLWIYNLLNSVTIYSVQKNEPERDAVSKDSLASSNFPTRRSSWQSDGTRQHETKKGPRYFWQNADGALQRVRLTASFGFLRHFIEPLAGAISVPFGKSSLLLQGRLPHLSLASGMERINRATSAGSSI